MKPKKEAKSEEMPKKLLLSNISLILDGFDDIFSDFDPRDYSERALSVDFLREAERASKDKVTGKFELNLLVPSKWRNAAKERIIKQRLKKHFKKHFHRLQADRTHMIRSGVLFTFFGVLCMLAAVAIFHKLQGSTILASFLVVLLEPAGWFLFWEGLNHVIFEPRKFTSELDFYRKMHTAPITFFSY